MLGLTTPNVAGELQKLLNTTDLDCRQDRYEPTPTVGPTIGPCLGGRLSG